MNKLTKEDFINRSIAKHGDKYNYDNVNYINCATKVCIRCNKHGNFLQRPYDHMKGFGCKLCAYDVTASKLRKEKSLFIKEAINKHGYRYDYSKVNYVNKRTAVEIVCLIHGSFQKCPEDHLCGFGCPICGITKKRSGVCGIGVVDFPIGEKGNTTKCYHLWVSMIKRCYDDKELKKHPSYKGCTVCEEWKLYSNFKKWFDDNYVEGYQLDKDILVKGNKVYSPGTCCFVPNRINSLVRQKKRTANKSLPLGVSYDKIRGKYIATCKGDKQFFLGSFDCIEEAHKAYISKKKEIVKEIIDIYFEESKIGVKVYNALLAYYSD